jgi:hypothetical protein
MHAELMVLTTLADTNNPDARRYQKGGKCPLVYGKKMTGNPYIMEVSYKSWDVMGVPLNHPFIEGFSMK